jgi:hypothetical protein
MSFLKLQQIKTEKEFIMVSENTKQNANTAIARSFKSPMFLAIAICFSVIFVAVLIATFTMQLGIATILALIFSGVSTLCAWLLYATPVTKGKIKNLRLYIAYRKVMNTISIVLVSIFGAIIVAGCVVLGLMSDIIKEEIVPMLEDDVKPMLEEIVAASDELENEFADLEELYDEMPQEIRDLYGIDDPEELVNLVESFTGFAEDALEAWDDIIEVLNTGFMALAVAVAIVYVVIIVAMCFISSALKKTSKYLKAFAKNENTDRKAPFIVNFIGGGLAAIGGIVCLFINVWMGLSALVTAATVILFAIFFKQMNAARAEEALAAEEAVEAPAAEIEEAAEEVVAEEAVAEEAVAEEAHAEEAPVEATAEVTEE